LKVSKAILAFFEQIVHFFLVFKISKKKRINQSPKRFIYFFICKKSYI